MRQCRSDGGGNQSVCCKKAIDSAAARLERAFNGSLCIDPDGLPITDDPSVLFSSRPIGLIPLD